MQAMIGQNEDVPQVKEAGYDQWLLKKISHVRTAIQNGTSGAHTHEQAMQLAWQRLQEKMMPMSA